MFSRRLKRGYFFLEGLNSFALVYYFYYFYFFMQKEFGFGNKANLVLAALNGATYALFAWWAGKFAQRFGYFTALKVGFVIMMGALVAGSQLRTAAGQIIVMLVTVLGMCFTWPTLEALVSEAEDRAGLQHMVGVYNVIWATTAAAASFSGGAVLQKLGVRSLFFVPIGIQIVQLALTLWLERTAGPPPRVLSTLPLSEGAGHNADSLEAEQRAMGTNAHPVPRAASFLRMAWLANPFAYVAINTVIAVVPGVAQRLSLSTMLAGFCCSVWCFARLGAFTVLWRWAGWHYRFRWLLAAYMFLVASFTAILLTGSLAVLVVAQILFGLAVGLIYYSSLFYSMDLSEAKGEHGGIHEAVIGVGNFAGPAVGAAALQFLPAYGHSGAVAVSFLLVCGLGGLAAIWRFGRTPGP